MPEKYKRLFVSLVAFVFVGVVIAAEESNVLSQQRSYKKLIRDGFVVFGVDGAIEKDGNSYFFIPDTDIVDSGAKIKAGSRVALLLSSGLDKAVSAMGNEDHQSVRLWGSIVSFKKENFIYISYSLPIMQRSNELKTTDTSKEGSAKQETAKKSEVLPDDVLKKLHPEKFVNIKQLRSNVLREQDVLIVDRIGFIQRNKNDEYVLTFNAFGQNISNISFGLLPCRELERVIDIKSRMVVPMRFKVVGVATQFKGNHYMLLQRVTPAFSNGNFSN